MNKKTQRRRPQKPKDKFARARVETYGEGQRAPRYSRTDRYNWGM